MKDHDLEQRVQKHLSRYHHEDQTFTTGLPMAFEEIGDDIRQQASVFRGLNAQIEATQKEREKEIHSLCQGNFTLEQKGLKEVGEGAIHSQFAVELVVLCQDRKRDFERIQGNSYEQPNVKQKWDKQEKSLRHQEKTAINRLHRELKEAKIREDERQEEQKEKENSDLLERIATLEKRPNDDEKISKSRKPFTHSNDYCSVSLRGQPFSLTSRQAEIVEILHKAHSDGHPELKKSQILNDLNSPDSRWEDAFRSRKKDGVWGTLIIRGSKPGMVRLNI